MFPRPAEDPYADVLGICAAILAPTLAYRIGVDQGVFFYMGDVLLKGGWPYVATWENDYPGLIFIQALQMLVMGKSVAAFRLFDVSYSCAVPTASLSRPVAPPAPWRP